MNDFIFDYVCRLERARLMHPPVDAQSGARAAIKEWQINCRMLMGDTYGERLVVI